MSARRVGARRPAPTHAPRVPFAILVVGLIIGGMCALLALNTASAANELSRHDLAAKDAAVAAAVQQLRNEVAASAAPGSLGSAAAALGMVPAGNPAFLKVGADGKVQLLGSAAPATAAPVPTPAKPTPAKPTTSKTATPTKPATKTATSTKTAARSSTSAKATPTPTPTVTIPGGQR